MSKTLEAAEGAYGKANADFKLDNCGANYRARDDAAATLLHERRRIQRIGFARKAIEDAEASGAKGATFVSVVAAFLEDDLRQNVAPSRLEDTDPAND